MNKVIQKMKKVSPKERPNERYSVISGGMIITDPRITIDSINVRKQLIVQ